MAERDPLDFLVDRARSDVPPPEELEALRKRLALPPPGATGDGAPGRRSTGAPGAGRGAKMLLLSALALVVVVLGILALGPGLRPRALPATEHVAPRVPVARPTSLPSTPRAASPAPEGTPTPTPARTGSPARPETASNDAPPTLPAASRRVPSEVEIVEQANAALRRGDLGAARRALARHRSAYPAGLLVEERRSLEVELAVELGDATGARRALDAFTRDYTTSAHRARLERLLATTPSGTE